MAALLVSAAVAAASSSQTLKRTLLFDRHVDAGAKLVPFAGWQMPVQYGGIRDEHLAVRNACGVFDVSHMGEIETSGPQAQDLLQHLLSNDVSKVAVGGAQYSVLTRDDGGVLDDLFTYRLAPDRFLTVTNAANHEKDLAWFQAHAGGFEADVADAHDKYAMLAVQGPRAREVVQAMADAPLPARFTTARRTLTGRSALVCGTGYTGEDGVELLIDPEIAPAIWAELLDAGVVPCGLGARDTLRLEVCFHLHGQDLTPDRNPIEAGLGWCCKEETGFIGAEPIAAVRASGPGEKLVPFTIEGRGIPRPGNEVYSDGEPAGVVTSGTFSPSLEVGIGMAYVAAELAEPGTGLEIDVRGRRRPAKVGSKPLYKKEKS